jgi:geranylgeranyl transferase type-2 subunit alpha
MHGKKLAEYKAQTSNPKIASALAAKAQQWHTLMKELASRRQLQQQQQQQQQEVSDDTTNTSTQSPITNSTTTTTTLALLEKALLVNPDPLNLWNHRREVMLQAIKEDRKEIDKIGDADQQSKNKFLETERVLTQAALQRNPKAYGAWFHRKWVVQTFLSTTSTTTTVPNSVTGILQEELDLTSLFLNLDERNFHCWSYRRFVVACIAGNWSGEWIVPVNKYNETTSLMGPQVLPTNRASTTATALSLVTTAVSDTDAISKACIIPSSLVQSEWQFTTTKIEDNFSNFSAFHYRSQLLQYMVGSDNDGSEWVEYFQNEIQLIEDAVCTEPADQTPWWYHAILLDKLEQWQVKQEQRPKEGKEALLTRLKEHADLLQDLLNDDLNNGKWIMLGLLRVLQILDSTTTTVVLQSNKSEQTDLLQRLMEVDSDRSGRYQAMLHQME